MCYIHLIMHYIDYMFRGAGKWGESFTSVGILLKA
jgi:hypothetical protein